MRFHPSIYMARRCGLVAILAVATVGAQQRPAATVSSGRITIAGTSNVHAYTASTSSVRVVRIETAVTTNTAAFWEEIAAPGALTAFEVAIPAASLVSGKDGLDKNMHKALKVEQHPDIVFRLSRFQPGTGGALKALGMLKIAGVEREITFDVTRHASSSSLTVKGEVDLLMTDYGIAPPKAMLGMLKTDPKVKVAFEVVLSLPLVSAAFN